MVTKDTCEILELPGCSATSAPSSPIEFHGNFAGAQAFAAEFLHDIEYESARRGMGVEGIGDAHK
jgi:hypothetical protein